MLNTQNLKWNTCIPLEFRAILEYIGIHEYIPIPSHEDALTRGHVVASAKQMPPAMWWATFGKHMPKIASVARRVLAQPVCASAAERNWSVYGQIMTGNRARVRHERADMLVYCHETLHIQKKLQCASYVQHAAKWDSDSDSDETDEEDLMV